MRYDVFELGARVQFQQWVESCGGVAVWQSVSDGQYAYTPSQAPGGRNVLQPHPFLRFVEAVSDLGRFRFLRGIREVERFRFRTRTIGGRLALDRKSERRLKALLQSHPGATYRFDQTTSEAIVEVPEWEE